MSDERQFHVSHPDGVEISPANPSKGILTAIWVCPRCGTHNERHLDVHGRDVCDGCRGMLARRPEQ